MPKMNQSGTDKGQRHETGEKLPKGDTSSDTSGERKEGLTNGVGMGKADRTGSQVDGVGRSGFGQHDRGEFNSGRKEGNAYDHKRIPHTQD